MGDFSVINLFSRLFSENLILFVDIFLSSFKTTFWTYVKLNNEHMTLKEGRHDFAQKCQDLCFC